MTLARVLLCYVASLALIVYSFNRIRRADLRNTSAQRRQWP